MLYHKNIGFPCNINIFSGIFELIYTNHALKASENDKYGRIILPKFLDTEKSELVEIEVKDSVMIKGVFAKHVVDKAIKDNDIYI